MSPSSLSSRPKKRGKSNGASKAASLKSSSREVISRIIGEGEMAELIRAFDWAKTPLGPIESWPDTLITTVNMLLASRHPMFLWWGPDLIQFYNDGYRPSIRDDKHPKAVGQRGVECWPEIWPIIGPQIEAVMSRGESTWNRNQLVPINRNRRLEEVYWTYSYSPIRDNNGEVQGTLVVCSETTEQVLSERRLRTLLGIGSEPAAFSNMESVARAAMAALDHDKSDIPFAALYLLHGSEIHEAGSTDPAGPWLKATNWPLKEAIASQTPRVIENPSEALGSLVGRSSVSQPWPEAVTSAYVLPFGTASSTLEGALVFGISARLPFGDAYRTFLGLVANRIASLLESERHAIELLQATKRFESLAEANPFGMMIGNLEGDLSFVNPAFLRTLGYSEAEMKSVNLRRNIMTPPEYMAADAHAVEQLRTLGRCDVYEKEYIAKDGRRISVLVGASMLGGVGPEHEAAAFVTDLTSLKTAEDALRQANEELEKKVAQRTAALEAEVADRQRAEAGLRALTGRLLQTQDEERRHMARELHDHAGQTLVALSLNLHQLQTKAEGKDGEIVRLAGEGQKLSDDLSKEIRTLSYLLHPPLLDEAGLFSALGWYVEGFSQRSKIHVDLRLPQNLGRLSRDLELVVFRIVQESLTNVHRHSGSSWAKIQLARSKDFVEFEISDGGGGISAERQREMKTARSGVGVRGMEERVRQFNGTLEIVSDKGGTKVVVRLPMEE